MFVKKSPVMRVLAALALSAGGLLLMFLVLFAFTSPVPVAAAPSAEVQAGPLYTTYTTMTVTALSRNGITVTLSAAVDGQKFSNNGKTFVQITNGNVGTITATFITPGTIDGLAIADLEVPVGAGVTKMVGPFAPSRFNQPTGTDMGKTYIEWSDVTTVTVGAFRLN